MGAEVERADWGWVDGSRMGEDAVERGRRGGGGVEATSRRSFLARWGATGETRGASTDVEASAWSIVSLVNATTSVNNTLTQESKYHGTHE